MLLSRKINLYVEFISFRGLGLLYKGKIMEILFGNMFDFLYKVIG